MQEWHYPFKSVQRRSKLPQKRRAGGFKSVLYRVKCFRFSPLDRQAFALSKTDLIPTESCIFKLIGYKDERREYGELWVEAMIQTTLPLYMINGIQDPISGRHMLDYYIDAIPNAKTSLLDVGHYPQLEAPTEVLRLFLIFLKGIK